MRAHLIAAVLLSLTATSVAAQQATSAIVPQSITVGDVFHAAVRLQLLPTTTVQAPDSIVVVNDLEPAGRSEVRYDSASGARTATVLFPLTAWRPGSYQLPAVRLRLVTDGAISDVSVALPAFTVTSVLPQDTSNIEPRAAKDVLGANRVWWPILLALLLALAVAIALYMWWRRRRPQPVEIVTPSVPPRVSALAQLDALRAEGLIERGELRVYYVRLTEVLRHYAATVDAQWGVDLTTSELTQRMRAAQRTVDAVDLVRILGTGDMVKFARARPDTDTARRDLDAARAWIERVGPAAPLEEERRAA